MREALEQFLLVYSRDQQIEALAGFVSALRPGRFSSNNYATQQLIEAIAFLEENEKLRNAFVETIHKLFETSRLVDFFTDSGIAVHGNFFSELFARIRHKVLPELTQDNHFSKIIQEIFPFVKDSAWVNEIEDVVWERFFSLFTIAQQWHTPHLRKELSTALNVLSIRVASAGLEKPIASRLPVEALAETFSEQTVATDAFLDALILNDTEATQANFQLLRVRLIECKNALVKLQEQSLEHGTSLEQTFLIRRVETQLKQMDMIATMLNYERKLSLNEITTFFKQTVYHVTNRYAIRDLIGQNIGLLSYQIAEHKSKSGEHYITTTRTEFMDFFVASCKGGVIIAFVVIAKIFIHHSHAAPFWEAVLFSLNYAAGFILIHITHAALATKQPAMTASKIAASLDDKKGDRDLYGLAILVAQTSRSQIISFAGNLLVVFPLPFLFAYLLGFINDAPLVSDVEALGMLNGVNPLKSLAWLYAAFTGIFLFVSGIISGYWDNRVIYAQIPERIRQHPYLKRNFSPQRINKIAVYVEQNAGALIGNFSLGFFLGTAAFIGNIFGLPYDIRHITISSGNYAIGLLGLHQLLSWQTYVVCFIGVLGIGFINFLVSFTLAFIVAIRSRGVRLKRLPGFSGILGRYFLRYPGDFIRPPKEPRKPEDLIF